MAGLDGGFAALLLQPWALGLLGLCIGSFLNVVAHRYPRMLERQWWGDAGQLLADRESAARLFGAAAVPPALGQAAQAIDAVVESQPELTLSRPRSRCPACGHAIAWHENLPVLGWLRLRGRCSACQSPIGWRYPAVEAFTGLLFAAIGWRFGPSPESLMWCAVAGVLLAASLIDWDTTLLPDALTQPLLWAGLLAAWAGWSGLGVGAAVLGAVAGYLSLWAVYWLFKLVTGKEGMGAGDFKLLAALGAWLGAPALLPVVILASVCGAVVGLAMKAGGRLREGLYVPFGPFLAGGGLVLILVGPGPVLSLLGLQALAGGAFASP